MYTAKEVQVKLFEQIAPTGAKGKVEEIGEVLNLTRSAVYKRMNGNKLLAMDELIKLSEHFSFSIDSLLFQDTDLALFSFPIITEPPHSYEEFLNSILMDLERFSSYADAHLYYVTNEIPFFYYFFFPELTAFKLFVWGRTIWNWPHLQKEKFNAYKMLNYQEVHKLTDHMLDLYLKIPSLELWNTMILNNTIKQILYYQSGGIFDDPEEAVLLGEQMKKLVTHFRDMSSQGKKFKPGEDPKLLESNFQLYHNEITNCNNTILAVSEAGKLVFTTFGNPNFMRSYQEKMTRFAEDWFELIRKRSTSISGEGERNREQFFDELDRKVDTLVERLELQP